MLTESINYPRRSDDWTRTVLVGGALGLVATVLALVPIVGVLAVIPGVFVAGYLVRTLRASAQGEETPPAFDDWRDLGADGLKATLISIAYGLVPAVIGGGLILLGGVGLFAGGDSGLATGAGALTMLVGALLAFALGLIAAYVVPAALANYAETGALGDGFAFGEIRRTLTTGTYATAWLVGFAFIVAAGIVSGVLNAIPFLGVIVGPFVTFYAAVAAYHVIGRAWGELHPVALAADHELGEREEGERPAV